jgi:hypothetical protein
MHESWKRSNLGTGALACLVSLRRSAGRAVRFLTFKNSQKRRTVMKSNIVRRMLVNLSIPVVLTALLSTAYGQSCSLARAAGQYGFSDSGTVVGVGPRVAVGKFTLDAAGNLNGKATSSLNGTIADETFSGTYTANSDCTGTFNNVQILDLSGNLLLTITADLAWDDNMKQLRFIFTSAVLPNSTSLLTVINGEARKLVP